MTFYGVFAPLQGEPSKRSPAKESLISLVSFALFARVRVQPLIALAPWCLRLKLNHGDLMVMHEAKFPRRADTALES